MRWTSLSVLILLLASRVLAQGPAVEGTDANAIHLVQTLPVSSLDHDLPKVTLAFFLRYEGGGGPIQWEVKHCGENQDTAAGHDSAMCVRANVGLKDGRAAAVIISIGNRKGETVSNPTLYGVNVTYPGGTMHRLDHLRDLPVELHRPLPKGPKDLPSGVSA
jgi:hypothetical protein